MEVQLLVVIIFVCFSVKILMRLSQYEGQLMIDEGTICGGVMAKPQTVGYNTNTVETIVVVL